MTRIVRIPVDRQDYRFLRIPNGMIADRYRLVQRDGAELPETGEIDLSPLGRGGFGAVVRAIDPLGISRAIKVVLDIPSLHASGEQTDLFRREIRLTNARPFKNVIPVMDYGVGCDADGHEFGFFVSHYVEGTTLEDYVNGIIPEYDAILAQEDRRDRLHDQILVLMSDILAALVELDQARVVHMDLKPQNILVYHPERESGFPAVPPLPDDEEDRLLRAFVIDLGAGKPVYDSVSPRTHLRCTRYWFPEHLRSPLGYRDSDHTIDYQALRTLWRNIDLFSCGRVFEWMLLDRYRRRSPYISIQRVIQQSEEKKEEFYSEVFGDDFSVIQGFIDRMLTSSDKQFARAEDARLAFDTIPLKCAKGVLFSETLTDKYPGIRIRVGGSLVRVSHPFHLLVDHSSFQRLRHLQQLAFVNQIFPDGSHNRLSHSLRTFHLAKQFVLGLNRKSVFRSLFQRKDVDELLAAALLHDVGQYPFSHSIEDLRKMGDLCGDEKLRTISHDQERAGDALARSLPGELSIATILESHGLKVENILYIFRKTPKEAAKTVALNVSRDIIAGTIDVDRATYLLHDSERTGVPYGRAIDIGSLIEALTIRWSIDTEPDGVGLAIDEEGVSAAEALLTAVYWMYRNVYWRHTNRAFMAAVKYVMRQLLHADVLTFDQYWDTTYFMSDLEALRFLSQAFDHHCAQVGQQSVNPISDLANMRRLAYRRVFTLPYHEGDQGELYDHLVRHISPQREDDLVRGIEQFLPAGAAPRAGEILVDVPLKRRLRSTRAHDASLAETRAEKGTRSKLWVCCRSPLTKEITGWPDLAEYSPLAARMGEIEDHSGRKIRVFFSSYLLDRLGREQWKRIESHMFRQLKSITERW